MRILLAGFGTVGRSLVQLLTDEYQGIRLVGVLTQSRGALYHPGGLDCRALSEIDANAQLSTYPNGHDFLHEGLIDDLLAADRVDALVDATPTILPDAGPALPWCQRALERGIDLVLANKAPLIADFAGLQERAKESGARLRYEATVMAGTPVFNLARHGLSVGQITSARGILNGTCNYILTRMEASLSFADALCEAQELGYAEADASADIDGWDTAVKLVILSSVLFGRQLGLEQVKLHSLRHLTLQDIQAAREKGKRWKYVGTIDRHSVRAQPIALPLSDPLTQVDGAQNALTLQCEPLGEVTIQGPGAGGRETAFGILNDLRDLQRSR